jgi:multidrug efflux pump subunit AcrA (membrane-fusion protein)
MRKTILSSLGSIIILAIAVFMFMKMADGKKAPQRNTNKSVPSVTVESVTNSNLPIEIKSTGSVLAKDRVVLYSEVQGVFQSTNTPFKAGVKYSQGQTLIRINNEEFAASVKSQRIAFKSLITSLLADVQFDHPSELNTWSAYASSISADQTIPPLPVINNEHLSNYMSIKNVSTNYYAIKNSETRLRKYSIPAPFSGVLVEANITPGTLVSPGQKLGVFVRPDVYELELNVNAGLIEFLQVGKNVKLISSARSKSYTGKVSRINAQVDRASQTVQAFVQITSKELNEGEYLEAQIEAQEMKGVMEIPRNLIIDQNHVFLVEDGKIKKEMVSIIHSNENNVVVKGLKDGAKLITILVPGGYDGMSVTIRK